jgi:hypothetical protein
MYAAKKNGGNQALMAAMPARDEAPAADLANRQPA